MLSEKIIKTIHEEFPELQNLVSNGIEAEAQKIRDMIPSGFVELGELDYDYMLNNENVVKLKTKSIAYVNGYRIEIPTNTVVDIGKAPEKEAREDLLFLEVWKDEDFLKDGQVKWRIRFVDDVDFEKVWFQSNNGADKYIGLNGDGSEFSKILPQGGRETPLTMQEAKWSHSYQNRFGTTSSNIPINPTFSDVGLWSNVIFTGGVGENKERFKTLDGWVYAIPMFRLYRKPSCGKAIPFEYQKINPKVDYTKFAKLMKEERIERVVGENIQGQSLVNLLPPVSEFGGVGITNLGNNTAKLTQTGTTEYFQKRGLNFKNNTVYTFIYTIVESTVVDNSFCIVGDSDENILDAVHRISSKVGVNYYSFTSSNTNINPSKFRLAITSVATEGTYVIFKDIMLLEGDWTNKEIPKYFTGLKSLGEDEGNLIEVKTGILNPSSYDPSTGNVKLNTISGTNYITSDNLITPNIEAQVKRGDSKLSDLTQFGKIGDMIGDEEINFSKIKGKTLQNIAKYSSTTGQVAYYSSDDSYKIDYSAKNLSGVVYETVGLQPGVTYTFVIDIIRNDIDNNVSSPIKIQFGNADVHKSIGLQETGRILQVITMPTDKELDPFVSVLIRTSDTTTGSVKFNKFMVFKGDYSKTPLNELPYIKGICSCGEEKPIEIKTYGKNIFNDCDDGNWKLNCATWSHGNGMLGNKNSPGTIAKMTSLRDLNMEVGKTYITNSKICFYASPQDGISLITPIMDRAFTVPNKTEYLIIEKKISDIALTSYQKPDIYIYEQSEHSPYEPYVEGKKIITLKEPLRSLPNGVCDTVEGNKVIRRVGKVVLNGDSSVNWIELLESTNTSYFSCYASIANAKPSNYILCDKFKIYDKPINDGETEGIRKTVTNTNLVITIANSKLSSQDVTGFKTWLSQNPTTVYYELATPIEEIIEPNYDKESVKTYQLDAPLRSLPNGVKDEIVGDRLIRRCGEIIFNGSEKWIKETAQFYTFNVGDKYYKTNTQALGNILNVEVGNNYFPIIPLKKNSNIESKSVEEFKAMLKETPLKIVYELITPIEIPLKEVHSNTANFSLQRQFSDGNWLRELPNGVKDTVENGKVIRRVGKHIVTSNDSWVATGTAGGKYMELPISNLKPESVLISNTLKSASIGGTLTSNPIGIMATLTPTIRLKYTLDDCTLEGFKQWLVQNPTTIYYELKTPIEESLSTDNYMSYPCHEINTYCGSMYVGNGTNDVFVENGLGNDGVVMNTPFRSIENKAVVEDCKYKKSVDGYDIVQAKNQLDLNNFEVGGWDYSGNVPTTQNFRFRTRDRLEVSPNTTYTLYNTLSDTHMAGIQQRDENDANLSDTGWNSTSTLTFTTLPTTKYIRLVFNDKNAVARDVSYVVSKKPYLTMGVDSDKYIPYGEGVRCFENTESNDVDDLRHLTSLVGFNYDQILNESFDKLLRGEL